MLLPAVAIVVIDVAVDVRIMVVAEARRVPAVGPAGIGVVGRPASNVGGAFRPGGGGSGTVVTAAASRRPGHRVGRGTLPGVDVVIAPARDVAGTASRGVERPVVAARRVAGPGVELPPGVDVARRSARRAVGPGECRSGHPTAGVPAAGSRVRRVTPMPVDVGAGGPAARIAS